jgi:hypothetical protein
MNTLCYLSLSIPPSAFLPTHTALRTGELLGFVNLAGYGIHIDWVSLLSIQDLSYASVC